MLVTDPVFEKRKGEDKAVLAMIVSGLGLVVGMIIGALVYSSL